MSTSFPTLLYVKINTYCIIFFIKVYIHIFFRSIDYLCGLANCINYVQHFLKNKALADVRFFNNQVNFILFCNFCITSFTAGPLLAEYIVRFVEEVMYPLTFLYTEDMILNFVSKQDVSISNILICSMFIV